jgi:hypothetical protein
MCGSRLTAARAELYAFDAMEEVLNMTLILRNGKS